MIILRILLLGLRLWTEALLPALLQVLQADVAYAPVGSLRPGQGVNLGLYGKERRASAGTQFAISHLEIISYTRDLVLPGS